MRKKGKIYTGTERPASISHMIERMGGGGPIGGGKVGPYKTVKARQQSELQRKTIARQKAVTKQTDQWKKEQGQKKVNVAGRAGIVKQKATAASPVGKKQRILKAIQESKKKEKIANLKKRVGDIRTDVNNLAIRQKKALSERRKLIDMKNVVKAKTPIKIPTSTKVAVGAAAGVAVGYGLSKKKKSPVVKKKKSPVIKKKLRVDRIGKPSQWIK